jgi:hypothetical protein
VMKQDCIDTSQCCTPLTSDRLLLQFWVCSRSEGNRASPPFCRPCCDRLCQGHASACRSCMVSHARERERERREREREYIPELHGLFPLSPSLLLLPSLPLVSPFLISCMGSLFLSLSSKPVFPYRMMKTNVYTRIKMTYTTHKKT